MEGIWRWSRERIHKNGIWGIDMCFVDRFCDSSFHLSSLGKCFNSLAYSLSALLYDILCLPLSFFLIHSRPSFLWHRLSILSFTDMNTYTHILVWTQSHPIPYTHLSTLWNANRYKQCVLLKHPHMHTYRQYIYVDVRLTNLSLIVA